ncbi:hypothetical protein B0H16DRAFT_1882461 [Mycena metata]|uniref:Uncharacterized protein n=1 Tax=Mycena metata TaxID=1033252 RepID=A0AAD7JPE3_9AGAR|nr:hypothetical protein B0H16DRAFT_1882461 [Mycena metata]
MELVAPTVDRPTAVHARPRSSSLSDAHRALACAASFGASTVGGRFYDAWRNPNARYTLSGAHRIQRVDAQSSSPLTRTFSSIFSIFMPPKAQGPITPPAQCFCTGVDRPLTVYVGSCIHPPLERRRPYIPPPALPHTSRLNPSLPTSVLWLSFAAGIWTTSKFPSPSRRPADPLYLCLPNSRSLSGFVSRLPTLTPTPSWPHIPNQLHLHGYTSPPSWVEMEVNVDGGQSVTWWRGFHPYARARSWTPYSCSRALLPEPILVRGSTPSVSARNWPLFRGWNALEDGMETRWRRTGGRMRLRLAMGIDLRHSAFVPAWTAHSRNGCILLARGVSRIWIDSGPFAAHLSGPSAYTRTARDLPSFARPPALDLTLCIIHQTLHALRLGARALYWQTIGSTPTTLVPSICPTGSPICTRFPRQVEDRCSLLPPALRLPRRLFTLKTPSRAVGDGGVRRAKRRAGGIRIRICCLQFAATMVLGTPDALVGSARTSFFRCCGCKGTSLQIPSVMHTRSPFKAFVPSASNQR